MAGKYRSRYRRYNSDYYAFYRLASGLAVLYALFLGSLWFTNRPSFYAWLWFSIVVFFLIVGVIFALQELKYWLKQMSLKATHGILVRAGLEKHVIEFIDRFGYDHKKNG